MAILSGLRVKSLLLLEVIVVHEKHLSLPIKALLCSNLIWKPSIGLCKEINALEVDVMYGASILA